MSNATTFLVLGSTLALVASVAAMAKPSHATKLAACSDNFSSLSKEEVGAAKIWNRFADGYSKSPIKDEKAYQVKLAMTRKYLKPSSEVLEFGCGTGGTALLHAPFVKHYRAIDVSSRMIEIAQEKRRTLESNQNVQFECQGIDSLNASDDSYDVVLGMSVLHLVPNKDDVLFKVHQLLKPGGVFVSSTVCLRDFAGYLRWVVPAVSWLGVIPKVSFFTKDELRQSIEAAGFTIKEEFHPGNDKAVFWIAKKK